MFNYDFMQNAFFVAVCISLLCPCIGIFMVLRRSSMIGDTMSHASLAGITLGLLTNTNPILGAFIFTAMRRPYRVLAEILFSPPRFDSYHHLISQHRYSHYPHQFGQAES